MGDAANTLAHVDVLIASWRRPQLLQRALASVDRVREARAGSVELHVHVVDESGGSGAGPAAARNLAAARGRAEFIAILDDDDQWTSERLLHSIDILRNDPNVALVCGDMELTNRSALHGRVKLPPQGARLNHDQLALDCFVCTSTVTLRRSDWDRAGGMNEALRRAEDYDLWLRLTRKGREVRVLSALLGRYGEQERRLSDDGDAMAQATREVLTRSARLSRDRALRQRLGRLDAVIAHSLVKAGAGAEARALALRALAKAPTARVAWTAVGRSLAARKG